MSTQFDSPLDGRDCRAMLAALFLTKETVQLLKFHDGDVLLTI